MGDFDRRDFLKLVGAGAGAAAAAGCSDPVEKLIPYVVQPEEIIPGLPVVYASTCQECGAGCGLHVRTREGRPIKLEGNPEHPINRGKLCARGQAGTERTYHPDRFRGPLARGADGRLLPVGWDEATERLATAIREAGRKVAVLGAPTGPTLNGLIDRWLAAIGGGTRVVYDPLACESVLQAAEVVFGVASRPIFDLSDTDFVVDFGANALAVGESPVEHARQLAAARDASREAGRQARLVYVGPRLDLTASFADEWLAAKPGSEGILALGIARVAFDTARSRGIAIRGDTEALERLLSGFDAASVASSAGVPEPRIRRLGVALLQAQRPAALPPGISLTSRRATATAAAVLVLNAVVGAVGKTLHLAPTTRASSSFRDMARLIDAMRSGDVDVLIIHGANPAYSLPADAGFSEALDKVGTVVTTASMPDETTIRADLILPDHTALESWGDASPRPGVRSLVQPTLRPLFDTQSLGDTLLAVGRALGGDAAAALPEGSFRSVLEAAWKDTDWRAALRRGGAFRDTAFVADAAITSGVARLEFKEPQFEGDGSFVFLPAESPLLGDGSGANLPWMQETPDPITKVAWQSWAEISQSAAETLGVGPGDVLSIETTYGRIEVPAWPRGGIRDDVVAVQIGQGHTVGRFASLSGQVGVGGVGGDSAAPSPGSARGVNVNDVLPALTDESGARAWLVARAKVSATGRFQRLPFTQGTDNQRGRMLGESISLAALAKGESPWAANQPPFGEAPSGEGPTAGAAARGKGHGEEHEMLRAYDPTADAEPSDPYRWGMTIDIDRCTGCSACVVACGIENNIPLVGEEGNIRHRQMTWLRIERFVGDGEPTLKPGRPGPQNHERLGSSDVRNSPMLCQQCGAAPCEPVCPVYATYHTPSGLNGMIYNRCIGTRYCSNNCPYKVRRFNWYDYQIETWPEPMRLGLNPDVTVRGQGVMEKCNFCVQRIQAARQAALEEGHAIVPNGGVETACQQTCPTDAITFGNLRQPGNPAAAVARRNQGRAYHALHVLNTRPAITYLAKVAREEGHEA